MPRVSLNSTEFSDFASSSGEVYSRAGRIFQGERLVLPLRDDQDGLNFIIGATVRTERIPDINEDHAEAFGPQQMAFIPLDVLIEESDKNQMQGRVLADPIATR